MKKSFGHTNIYIYIYTNIFCNLIDVMMIIYICVHLKCTHALVTGECTLNKSRPAQLFANYIVALRKLVRQVHVLKERYEPGQQEGITPPLLPSQLKGRIHVYTSTKIGLQN